jgi:putative ABC transport system permease protein
VSRFWRRWLLQLLPREVRDLYGDDITEVFKCRRQEELERRGRIGALRYGVRFALDVLGTAIRMRTARPRPFGRPQAGVRHGIARSVGTLTQDVQYGLRTLRKNPGFAIVAVLTLALGIGATTAIFSVVDAVLLQPLALPHPDRIVQIWDQHPATAAGTYVSVPNYEDYRDQNEVFESVAALQVGQFFINDPQHVEMVYALYSSPSFLPMIGVETEVGRAFPPDEGGDEPKQVVILSHGFWQQRFGGDPAVVGETLRLKGWVDSLACEIVGVLPRDFRLPPVMHRGGFGPIADPQVLLPTGLWSWGRKNRDAWSYAVLARLKGGVSPSQAQSNLDVIASRIAAEFPETNADYTTVVAPLSTQIKREYGRGLILIWIAAGFVLLIACVNVANLLLGRAVVRRGELVLRSALGAGRIRLLRQLLTENLLLSLSGGAVGIILALWGTQVLVALVPGEIYRLDSVGVDFRVLGFLLTASLTATLLFGLLPALRSMRSDPSEALKAGARTSRHGSLGLLRGQVVAQVAMALVLITGAGLLLRTFANLTRIDPGFEQENVMTLQLGLMPRPVSKYQTRTERLAVWSAIEQRVTGVPGVLSVARAGDLPLNGREQEWAITLADGTAAGQRLYVDFRDVSDGYFATMGMRLVTGRTFSQADADLGESMLSLSRAEATKHIGETSLPIIVSETAARQFWPGQNALGKGLYWGHQNLERISESAQWDPIYEPPWLLSVVGVVNDVKTLSLDQDSRPQVYFPRESIGPTVVRTAFDPLRVADAVRDAIEAVDPAELTVGGISTMSQRFSATLATERFRMLLLSLFATLALILATIGLFGVTAYSVSQRIREMGIRIALGARTGNIVMLVGMQGLLVVVLGMFLGLAGAFILTRFLASLLYGVTPVDPVSYTGSVLVLGVAALLACYLPTRRATKVDPLEVLRYE